MKKTLSILILALMLCASAYAAVEPVITVNGMSGTVNVAADSPVSISVKLTPAEKEGTDADCWLVGNAFGRWYYYTPDAQWTDIGETLDIARLRPVYQGRLVTLPQTDILYLPQPAAGIYTLYFGVDTNMNGKLDTDTLVFKAVNVVVGGSYSAAYSGSVSGIYTGAVYYSENQSESSTQYYVFPSLTPENRKQPVIQTDKLVGFIPLQNGYGVRVIESGEQHILRIVPLSDPEKGQVISELVLDENPYSGTIANGNMLYLFFSDPGLYHSLDEILECSSKSNTKIQVIDLSMPQTPVKRGSFELTKSYRPSSDIFQMDGSVMLVPYPDYKSYNNSYQITPGDLKGLLQLTEDGKQAYYYAEKRVRVLDFSDPDHPKEISDILLPNIRGVSRYFMNGRILYVSHFEKKDTGSDYYLSKIDLSDLSAPLISAPVNIPAPCIGTDPSGRYAFTVGGGFFSSLRLGTDRADLADKAAVGFSYESAIISDGFVYSESSDIVIADISNPEKLGLFYNYYFHLTSTTQTSISVLFAKNRRIFASVRINKMYSDDDARYVVCYDASNPRSLRVESFFESSIPLSAGIGILQNPGIGVYHYAFSDDTAYLSLGYYGLWVKSLNK